MFKILLVAINAKYIHSNPAVYSLKAYAGAEGEESVEIAEYTINNRTQQILADIYRRKPDAVAFSCYIWNIAAVRELVPELAKLLPGIPVWAGGPEASFEPQELLARLPQLTGIMVGEGEETFAQLLRHYRGNGEPRLREIRGLCLPAGAAEGPEESSPGGRALFTGARPLMKLDELPFYYEKLPAEVFENRIIYYESSRGCPFRCSYCLSSIDKQVRLRSLELVCKELQLFLDRRTPQVKFVDRTFNCSHSHAMGIWEYLKEHDNGVTNFHFEIAAELLREEELVLLQSMRPGLIQLEIGVQSTNPRTLYAISRSADLERLKQVTHRIREGGNIHQHLDLIAGLPYEDYSSFAHSFCDVYGMRPNQLQLGFLKVLKGSGMYERAAEYGIIYTDNPPYEVLYSKWLSYEDMLVLKQVEEMVELYYNSGQFTHVLPVLEQAFPSPFEMFRELARHYERNGYFIASPARSYRYHVLLEFASGCDGSRLELYKELCTFDIYLRENAKSRPDFARDLKPYRELCPRQADRETHAEVFWYPVWEAGQAELPARLDKPAVVLFDYGKRSPLDRSAAFTINLNEDTEEGRG